LKLYLVRHGQTSGNVRRALDTALPGPPLTELGQEQAVELVGRLSGEPIVAVYASEAVRARQTAVPLAASLGLDVQVVDGVYEVQAGDLEGLNDPASIRTYLATVEPWTRGELDSAMPNGESGESVHARMNAAVAQIRAKHEQADPDGIAVLVSHGGAIRLTADWVSDNVRPEVANAALIPNTGIVVLDAIPGGWHCLRWVDIELD
jgi:probable phosphoglycerate mutase